MDERKILAELLSCATKDHERLADSLLLRYKKLARLAEADLDHLSVITEDMPLAIYIKLSVAFASRRVIDSFKFGKRHTGEEIEQYFKALYLGASVETVYILSKDEKGRVISCDHVGDGTVNGIDILPRKLLEIAIKRGAKSVIIAHNHPGGTSKPSEDDYASIARIKSLLFSSGIDVESGLVVSSYGISHIEESYLCRLLEL